MNAVSAGGYRKRAGELFKDERTGVFLMIIVIFVILSFCSDAFLTSRNITNMLRQSSFYVMMGMGAMPTRATRATGFLKPT